MAEQIETVHLAFFMPPHLDALSHFELAESQLPFTSLPKEALHIALNARDERFPVTIMKMELPVGFFVLHIGEGIRDYTSNPKAVLLRAFSINYSQQRKGYAKTALQQLPEFVKMHFPDKNEIVLSVNTKNMPAISAYLKAGFRDRGEMHMGRSGPNHLLHFTL